MRNYFVPFYSYHYKETKPLTFLGLAPSAWIGEKVHTALQCNKGPVREIGIIALFIGHRVCYSNFPHHFKGAPKNLILGFFSLQDIPISDPRSS